MLPYWRERCGTWKGLVLAANTWGVECDTPFMGASAIFYSHGPLLALAASTGDEIISTPIPREVT